MGRFGDFLVCRGRIRPEHLKKAMEFQQMVGGRLGTNLLELDLIREWTLRRELGEFRKVRTATAIQLKDVPADIIRMVPPKIARRYQLVPIERKGNVLVVASADLVDPLVEDELGLLTSCGIRAVIGIELRLYGALEKYYGVPLPPRLSGLIRRLDKVAASRATAAAAAPTDTTEKPAAQPVPSPSVPAPPPPPVPAPSILADASSTAAPPAPPVEPEIQYIELDADTRAGLYSEDDERRPPAARLETAAHELQHIDIRDEIGDVILDFCRLYFRRCLLLIHRKKQIIGWRGEGQGVELESLRAIDIPAEEPSVFSSLLQGTNLWRGPVPALPGNRLLIDGLGGEAPKECLVLPISLRSRIVCFVYGDNVDRGIGDAPLPELRRLVMKAGLAFEVYILKNKIRTL